VTGYPLAFESEERFPNEHGTWDMSAPSWAQATECCLFALVSSETAAEGCHVEACRITHRNLFTFGFIVTEQDKPGKSASPFDCLLLKK